MRNYPEWIVAFAAITSVGGIAVSMNAWWKADEMAYGLEDSGAKLLIADRERIETAGPTLERLRVRSLAVRAEAGTVAESDRWEVVVVAGADAPEGRDRPRRRRHHSLHLGNHRLPKGGGLDPSSRALCPLVLWAPGDGGEDPLPERHRGSPL